MELSKKKFKIKSNEQTELGFLGLLKSCSLFLLVFIALCVFISVITAIFFYKSLNPSKAIDLISLSSLFISAFISSFLLSKYNGQKYLLGGILLGFMIFVILFIGALFTERKIFSAEFLLRLAVPAVTMIGALLGIKREKRNKRPKIRRWINKNLRYLKRRFLFHN